MTYKEFVKERSEVFYEAYFELLEKVRECRGKSIDDVPDTIYVNFDGGRYAVGCYHLTRWGLWDNSDPASEPFFWQLGVGGFGIITNMLFDFLQHCYDQDERFETFETEELA